MKKLLLFFGFLLCISVSAQEKKKDSATTDKLYEYKARFFRPSDCYCPGEVISKELKRGDNDFSPYQYKYQNPIKLDSIADEKKKEEILSFIRKI